MLIHVTEDHIKHGVAQQCNSCPVALALREHIKEEFTVRVATQNANIYTSRMTFKHVLYLPYKVSEFIYHFDQHKPVEPFSFEVEIPDAYRRN